MKNKGAARRMGLDTASYFTPYAQVLYDLGYRTIFRYLNLGKYFRETPCTDPDDWFKSLSKQEIKELLDIGFNIGVVQRGIGRANRGGPVAGRKVGEAAVYNAKGLGIPKGVTIFCDCEWSQNILDKVSYADQKTYIESLASVVVGGGYKSALYVSPDLKFDSQKLYALRNITAYWKSASSVPTVDKRGFQVSQSLETWYDEKTERVMNWKKSLYGRQGLRFDTNMLSIDGRGDRCRVIGT